MAWTLVQLLLADLSAEPIGAHPKGVVAIDAVLVTDGNRAYEAVVASQAERTVGCYHIENVNAHQSRFKSWLARFKGVS